MPVLPLGSYLAKLVPICTHQYKFNKYYNKCFIVSILLLIYKFSHKINIITQPLLSANHQSTCMDNLYPYHFLKLLDLDQAGIYALLSLAQQLKEKKRLGQEHAILTGYHFALIYEDVQIQKKQAFDIAARDLGAQVTHIGLHHQSHGLKPQLTQAQLLALGQGFDGILYYGGHHETLAALAKYSNCAVWNGLTDIDAQVSVLADLLAIQMCQEAESLQGIKLAYLGDARGNLPTSLLESAAIMGMDLRVVGSKAFWPNIKLVEMCTEIGKRTGAKITLSDDVVSSIKGVDFLYMNVWTSMIKPTEIWHKIVALLSPEKIMQNLMELTENQNIRFLHELPNIDNVKTTMGHIVTTPSELREREEITKAVLESNPSCALTQIDNQIHIIKAMMLTSLGK